VALAKLGTVARNAEILTTGTANIIRAIAQSHAKKLISRSCLGAGSTKKLGGWKQKTMRWLVGGGPSFEARAEQEFMLYQSSIVFTLVMASALQAKDGHPSQSFLSFLPTQVPCVWRTPPKIDRAVLALFLIGQLTTRQWRRRTICIVGNR
jgi:hypothetical protein